MQPPELVDRIYKGLNTAARSVGADTYAYRPCSTADPLDPKNRFLRLRAAFSAEDGRFQRASKYGEALWYGVFDAAYTRPGDYLVQGESTWFIAAQQRLLPVLCVRTNRTVSFARAAAPVATGINEYGGVTAATAMPLLSNWPASVLGATGGGRPEANLPADVSIPYWTVLLPAYPGTTLLSADLMTDDLGRSAVVAAAELTELGWRITARQATT